jgi:hypothetical protein
MTTTLAPAFDDQWRAFMVIEIGHLTIQAVMTFLIVDGAVRMNGLNFTLFVAQAAGVTTYSDRTLCG